MCVCVFVILSRRRTESRTYRHSVKNYIYFSFDFRAGSSDNLLGAITASSPGGSKVFQPTGGAFKSTHADTGEILSFFNNLFSNIKIQIKIG